MKSLAEFQKLTITELRDSIKLNHKITLPAAMNDSFIRDLAQNKLHGIEFIYDHESYDSKNKTISAKPIKPIKKNFSSCPNCNKQSFLIQKFADDSPQNNSKYCHKCGYSEKLTEALN